MKSTIKALCAPLLASLAFAAPAHADSFYVFGDSLVDNGNTPKFGINYPPPPYYDDHFSNGKVWAEYLPGLTGLSFQPGNDYGVGGAFAGPLNVLGTNYNNLENLPPALGEPGFPVALPSFLSEVTEFQATGQHFSASDVVGVWVGANDYFATLALVSAGYANASAINNAVQTVAVQTTVGVDELVNLGARRFLVFNLPNLGATPEFNQDGAAIIGEADEISAAHNSTLAQYMDGEHGSTGANIIVINTAQLFNELLANPAAYGKTNTTAACIDTLACVTASTAVQNTYVFWDAVHPTTGTHEIIAQYAADSLNGLAGLAAPAQIAAFGASAFTGQLDQRLEALRAGATGFAVNLPDQGVTGQVNGKLSGFLSGSYAFGSRNTIGADNGFNYNIGTVALGLDDAVAPGIAAGIALGYGTDHGNVSQDGTLSGNAYQFGAYASFFRPDFYLNLDVAHGFIDDRTTSPGVLAGGISGKPAGSSTSFGGESGFVLNAGPLAYGPVAGLNVTYAQFGTYTQTGDAALTQSVGAQGFTQVTGDVGGTVSAALPLGALALHPHLTATVDRLFSGNGGNFDSVFTDEPGVSLTTTYPNATKTWGEISGGVSAALTDRVSLGADFATTIAKSDGADHEVSGNLKVVF